jgi:DNA repair photolyase
VPIHIQAKTILSKVKHGPDPWFGTSYTINLYRGCTHGCIYCDTRSLCYQVKHFDEVEVKINALELLHRELRSKKNKGTIGFGSMNDCYMPLEKKYQLSRKALELAIHHRFPVHIITKSDLVLRDVDILRQLSNIYAAVSMTITSPSDQLSRKIEPHAPLSSQRFKAMEQLAREGIYAGLILMPVLPGITDREEAIKELIESAANSGAQYVIGSMGMTLREGNREYYYEQLDKHFPGLKQQYIKTYGEQYGIAPAHANTLKSAFIQTCKSFGLATKMNFYNPPINQQLELF